MTDKKIKTIFINPPFLLQDRYGKDLKNFGAVSEPLGIAYIAAILEKNNYPVSIIDAPALNLRASDIIKQLAKDPPDLVGITVLTPMHDVLKILAREIKENFSKIKIVIGGAHATALPKEILSEIKEIDYVCIGEGEETITDLVRFLEGKKEISEVDGLVYRIDGEVVFNKPRDFIRDLDEIPLPARHLLPMERYTLTTSKTKGVGYCPTLIVARGCPFNCCYCSHPFGRNFRHHSVEKILSEIKDLISKHNINQMNLEADTLTVDKKFFLDLCQGLIRVGISQKVRWTCESRVDTIDEEMLEAMKGAGCWQISYGVESGVQRLLDIINKGEKIEQIERIFRITQKKGITIRGFFMLGLPTETTEESWQTINFAKKLNSLWAQFTITIPYPGTTLFDMLRKDNEIRTFDWSCYNTWAGWAGKELPYVPKGRTVKELQGLQRKALISFYLRPKAFLKFLRQVNSLRTLNKYLLGLFILVKNKLSLYLDVKLRDKIAF